MRRGNVLVVAIAPLLLLAAAAPAEESWTYRIDSPASAVNARVAFFGLASKTAHFPSVSGRLTLPRNADPAGSRAIVLDVVIDARTIEAPDPVTLRRLKGPGFFDVERYPTVHFAGRSLRMTGERTAVVVGALTARDVTRDETLAVTFQEPPVTGQGRRPILLDGQMRIDRNVYGMTAWPFIVGRQVTIAIKTRMVPETPG